MAQIRDEVIRLATPGGVEAAVRGGADDRADIIGGGILAAICLGMASSAAAIADQADAITLHQLIIVARRVPVLTIDTPCPVPSPQFIAVIDAALARKRVLSTGAKVAIGIGVGAVAIVAFRWLVRR
jgi:hypothetical protein